MQDKCDLLNSFSENDRVKVGINLRGREWQSPQGETKFFNSIQGWRIESLEQSGTPEPPPPPFDPAENTNIEAPDDLPFLNRLNYVSLDRCFIVSFARTSLMMKGLLLLGETLKPERVIAYRKGIFPGLNLMTFYSGAQTLGWFCFRIKSKSRKACAQSCEKNSLK